MLRYSFLPNICRFVDWFCLEIRAKWKKKTKTLWLWVNHLKLLMRQFPGCLAFTKWCLHAQKFLFISSSVWHFPHTTHYSNKPAPSTQLWSQTPLFKVNTTIRLSDRHFSPILSLCLLEMTCQMCMCTHVHACVCVCYCAEPIGAKDHTLAHPVWFDLRGYSPFPSKQTTGLFGSYQRRRGREGTGAGEMSLLGNQCRSEGFQQRMLTRYCFAKRVACYISKTAQRKLWKLTSSSALVM